MVIVILLMLQGCQSYYFDAHHTIANDQWAYQDSIVFEFDIQDKTPKYNVFLDVQHRADYGFANLYVMVKVYFPDGRSRRDQVSLELANTLGQWQGKCNGDYCTRELPFMPNAVFEQTGKHRIVIEQFNRLDIMDGVHDFRLRIEQLKQ